MYKRTITFTDYNGTKRTEDHYFNLSKAEVIKWLTTSGDYTLDKVFEKIVAKRNGKEIMKVFDELIYLSYGEKSLDGRRFDKSEEVKRNFMETEAYTVLFTELVTDAKKAAEFINKIIPQDMADEISKIYEKYPDGIPDELKDYIPDTTSNVIPMA